MKKHNHRTFAIIQSDYDNIPLDKPGWATEVVIASIRRELMKLGYNTNKVKITLSKAEFTYKNELGRDKKRVVVFNQLPHKIAMRKTTGEYDTTIIT